MPRRSLRAWIGDQLEYLVLGVLIVGVLAAAAALYLSREDDDQKPTRRASPPAPAKKTCLEARITPLSRREGTCRTSTTDLTIVNGSHELSLPSVRVQVRSTRLVPASTPSGRARDRVRVELRTSVTNGGEGPFPPAAALYLVSAGKRVAPDEVADRLPRTLKVTEPLAPGETRRGVLRFELGGEAGAVVLRRRRAELGVRPTVGEGARPLVGVVRLTFPRPRTE